VSGRDITEGRAISAIAVDLGIQAGNTVGVSYDIAFMGNSNRLAFIALPTSDIPSNLGLWLQDSNNLVTSGWLQTGYIRYNTNYLKGLLDRNVN
jgi:hypothetical protein